MNDPARFPALFVSHGSPLVALDRDEYDRALARFAEGHPPPAAIVAVSAHWETRAPVRVSSSERPPTIHDFGGFPEELYRLAYPAPGAPELAREIVASLEEALVPATLDPARGLDHGAWVPLRFLYPDAGVPVVQVSLPRPRTAEAVFQIGRALAPLRDRGVLLFGSGGIVHNLGLVKFDDKHAPVDEWARAFDRWIAERLERLDTDALLSYEEAPHARLAVPTTEHLDPLFAVLGGARPDEGVSLVFEGFHHGNLSMRSFAIE
jgi:4,5-DOPA dioxygenase extradiol